MLFLYLGLAESLFSSQREDYVEVEQASLTQLFQQKVFILFVKAPASFEINERL
jgi:hypothetical protein